MIYVRLDGESNYRLYDDYERVRSVRLDLTVKPKGTWAWCEFNQAHRLRAGDWLLLSGRLRRIEEIHNE